MSVIKINGKDYEFKPGDVVLKIALGNGIFVPHYCYHPGLSPEGNCRMCLVKTSTSKKLEVSCMMKCADGMAIETETEEVQKARKDVLEFLLINHPLDCPVCDKAGECLLQDYTYEWRGGLSRFIGLQDKNLKENKDVGPNIKLWANRCIVCTRCVRFLNEISGTGELTVVDRADHSAIDNFNQTPVDNPLSLNIVDICPVGALIDKDFLYKARVWFTKTVESTCPTCSTGCSIKLNTLNNEVKRVMPRHNPDVNSYWICDEGRRNVKYLTSEKRLGKQHGTPQEIIRAAKSIIERHGKNAFLMIASSYNTCEELYLFKKVRDLLGCASGTLSLSRGEDMKFKSGFVINNDKTPNRSYINKILANGKIELGGVKGIFVLNGIPDFSFPPEIMNAAKGLEFVSICDILETPLSKMAHVCLPGATFVEKDGTYINSQSILQRIRKTVELPQGARQEIDILQEMLIELGERKNILSASAIFKEAFQKEYKDIPANGLKLNTLLT